MFNVLISERVTWYNVPVAIRVLQCSKLTRECQQVIKSSNKIVKCLVVKLCIDDTFQNANYFQLFVHYRLSLYTMQHTIVHDRKFTTTFNACVRWWNTHIHLGKLQQIRSSWQLYHLAIVVLSHPIQSLFIGQNNRLLLHTEQISTYMPSTTRCQCNLSRCFNFIWFSVFHCAPISLSIFVNFLKTCTNCP